MPGRVHVGTDDIVEIGGEVGTSAWRCQRHTIGRLVPTRLAISSTGKRSADSKMICAPLKMLHLAPSVLDHTLQVRAMLSRETV
jgi:hypothetical protein